MRARLLLPLVAVAGAALFAVQPAIAQDPYPPAEPVLTVAPTTVLVGDTVTVTGTGFEPGEDVLIEVATAPLAAPQFDLDEPGQADPIALLPVARTVSLAMAKPPSQIVTADEEGSFTAIVKLVEVGQATITATGQESGLSASATVTVLPRDKGKGLPETGSASWPLVRVGGVALGIGGILLIGTLVWHRRNRVDA